jgi:hypothetical protein
MTTILTNVEMDYNVNAGYGVTTEPFPKICDPSLTLALDFHQREATGMETFHQESTQPHVGLKDTIAHLRSANALNPTAYARTEAWLDQVTATKPFEEVLFFDASHSFDDEGLESLRFFNCTTLAHKELVGSSFVFCLPNREYLYDRAAVQAVIEHEAEVIYWGPKIKSPSLVASSPDPFHLLSSCAPTEDEKENLFYENEVPEETLPESYKTPGQLQQYDGDNVDEDDETETEASFCCVTAAAHDNALAEEKAHLRTEQSDGLSFRDTVYWVPPKYASKKKAPHLSICVLSSEKKHTVSIVRTLRSFQRRAPLMDKSVAVRAMQANMRDAAIVWPSHLMNFADIKFLPLHRMQACLSRPNASIFRPVHPEVKAQRETTKPLYLTNIAQSLDSLPAQHFPFELAPDTLRSLDLLRLPSATASVTSTHSIQTELVPASLQINSKGIWPYPRPCTIQPVESNVQAQWTHVKPQSYHQCHGAKRQCSGVQMNTASELMLSNVLKERKLRTPLVLKPFRFLGKLLRAAAQKRD